MTDDPECEIDLDKVARGALEWIQFGFALKPVSSNDRLIPVIRRGHGGAQFPTMAPTKAFSQFKDDLYRLARVQARRIGWIRKERRYSFWVIARDGALNMDVANLDKVINDVFVQAELVPDDKHCRDCRQLWGDFEAAGLPDTYLFAVLIRWEKPITVAKRA